MKYSIQIAFMIIAGCSYITIAQEWPLKNDREAYNYCLRNDQAFIAIVWPIAKGHQDKVIQVIEKYGQIFYFKERRLNKKEAFELLEMSHTSVPSILMSAHVSWYFPKDTWKNNARIFVVKFPNAATGVACKQEIRRFFDLSYRSIHCSDDHRDTMQLAEYFFRQRNKDMTLDDLIAAFADDQDDLIT